MGSASTVADMSWMMTFFILVVPIALVHITLVALQLS